MFIHINHQVYAQDGIIITSQILGSSTYIFSSNSCRISHFRAHFGSKVFEMHLTASFPFVLKFITAIIQIMYNAGKALILDVCFVLLLI